MPREWDATTLVRVAAELPRGSVTRRASICRAAHSFPLGDQVDAIRIEDLQLS